MANINRIEFTTTTLYVHLSDNTFTHALYTHSNVAFLYAATTQQRNNWSFEDRDRAIVWPELGEKVLLDDKHNLVRYVAPVAEPEPIVETV
jgi:hypothetical protein